MGTNLRAIRRKTKTVRNIWQITRAMQMVSAAKLKRVQPTVEASREYMRRLTEVTASVAASCPAGLHPYLQQRPVQAHGVVVIAGDKGLCGSHNVNLLRTAEEFLASLTEPARVYCVGAKAIDYGRRRQWDVVGQALGPGLGDESRKALTIAREVRGLFDSGQVDTLQVIYTEFRSPMQRPPAVAQLVPIGGESMATGAAVADYIFEPEAERLLATLLPRTVEARLVNMLLQSLAAEHAARMTAMSAATENAEELRGTLTRELNRARQQQITSEILEVVSGADALQQGE
jgi:F-type H+-transporting ATPase subunit gamma